MAGSRFLRTDVGAHRLNVHSSACAFARCGRSVVLAMTVLVLRRRVRPSCDESRREDSMREGGAWEVLVFLVRS